MTLIVDFPAKRRVGARKSRWLLGSAVAGTALGATIAILPPAAAGGLLGVLGVLVILIFWTMPEPRRIPLQRAWVLFVVVFALSCFWPAYVALFLPGLPWLDITRLTLAVFLVIWLYCYFNSSTLRQSMAKYIRTSRVFFYLLAGFSASMLISIAFSIEIPESINQFVNYQLMRTAIVFAAVSMVATQQRALTLFKVLAYCALLEAVIGYFEAHYEHILWLDSLPPGFAANNAVLQNVLSGVERAGEYRVQGSFLVSLSYAEFLALASAFTIHLGLAAPTVFRKAFYFGIYLLIFPPIYFSGSRLGMVGYFTVSLLYAGFFALRTWQASRSSMIGPVLIVLFPLVVGGFAGALMSSNRLYVATIGGGQHEASNEARDVQLEMSIPKIAARPLFGYGVGQGSVALGYTSPGGGLTLDNYVIFVILSIGLVGFFFLLGMLLWTIWTGIRLYIRGTAPSSALAGPIAISLIAFCIIKWVLAQAENELLIFLMMGVMVCLNQIEVAAGARAPNESGLDEQAPQSLGVAKFVP